MKSCAISWRATVLGRKRWALAVCLVWAAGHCPCSAPLSGMPLGIIVVVIVVRCHCRCRCTLSSSSSHRALLLLHRARRRRRHPSLSSSLRRRLAAPCAVVHRCCTVVLLSRCWIRCRRLPPSSLLRRLRRRAVRCRCRGAIGCRRCTVFALPGPPPSPLGVSVPCTCLAAPLCHPTASVCIVVPLCAAIVIVRSAHALCSWRPFSGTVPGPWACRWGGGEGAAGAPCVWHAWLSSSWPDPTKPAPHSSAQRWGCSWPTVVVWCVLGIPDGGCGGGSTALWLLVGHGARVVGD